MVVRALGINSTGLQNTVDANYSAHALDRSVCANIVLLIHADAYTIPSARLTHMQSQWTSVLFRAPRSRSCTPSGCFATRPLILRWRQARTSYEAHSIGRISARSRILFVDLSFMRYTIHDDDFISQVSFVLDDFDAARSSAEAFDEMIRNVTLSHITGYTDLLALVSRQIFGTLEITVSKSSDGTWNQSDIMIFSKDMGDVGASGTSGGLVAYLNTSYLYTDEYH